jgi:hypothetical protein
MEGGMSEKLVREFLEKRGFSVAGHGPEQANGIDIVAIKGGHYFLIEVKRAFKQSRAMRVKNVGTSGSKCNYVAIVTPKNNVILQPMSEHKKLSSQCGSRAVTELVRIHDMLLEGEGTGDVVL